MEVGVPREVVDDASRVAVTPSGGHGPTRRGPVLLPDAQERGPAPRDVAEVLA